MIRIESVGLLSSAGPRVRSPRLPARSGALSERALAAGLSGASDAATLLLHELQGSWRELIPWVVDRPDPLRRLLVWVPLAVALPFAMVGVGVSWPLAFATFLVACAGWRSVVGRSRRVALVARILSRGIAEGVSLECLEPEVVDLLDADPEHDAARLMLALRRLEEGQPLSALVQLAPLRDRHPDAGIVVVLAALAYARLRAFDDAVRMLQALRLPPEHAWSRRLTHFGQLCAREAGACALASSDLGSMED